METILIMLYVYAFVVGICVASFINVVIYRLPLHLDFIKGRSFCPHCQNNLKAYDMIPVFSWIILGGKCRFCKEPISMRYPFVELLGGLLAIMIFHTYGFSWNTVFVFVFSMVLLAIAFIDYDTMEIPNGLVIFCLICAIINIFLGNDITLMSRLIGFFMISAPMIGINLLVNDSFGGGDIKLMAVCGILLGWKNILLAMFIGIVLAGIYAIILMVRKRVDKKAHIAFGPYLCVGIFVALLYGESIINSYLSFFGL